MEQISLKKFEKNKLSTDQLSKIIGSGRGTSSGNFGGSEYTDEYNDSNNNGTWDAGETGCVTMNKQKFCGQKA